MIVVITQMKEKKMSSDPREKEDEKADLKYELTLRKNELKLLWQALYNTHENTHDSTEKEKYSELMKKVGSILERQQ
ncbi:MAG: hypothetical protein WAM88_11155 [Nitrososphaeraceae archaeon]